MKLLACEMEIIQENEGHFIHVIKYNGETCHFSYDPVNRILQFQTTNQLTELLKNNLSQLHKILHTKRLQSFYVGFRLDFVLTDLKITESFNDMSRIIVLDRRNNDLRLEIIETGIPGIHEIFTDGCYLNQANLSGHAAIIKHPDGKYSLFTTTSKAGNSCLAELEAAIKGFEVLQNTEKIRLVTDSRYVRKGLTEWLINWRLNDWKTANGDTARNIDAWKKIDTLTQGKYIEVAWVKGHSGQFENTMCDLYARDAAEKKA